ncbi:cobyric acid synthase [Blastococcus sp. BMG 814]|uniref:Cobyric acid synthase n=1 Tax=Blastococcus carthaginiensis TaxID=3050034 RepID=A0ABT9IEQ6_9ACTN|nr:cobyric acid synthase [Blastococcus carthaginiensis]MDP5184069.1 cobyric acid synthase [Blastococcus carthaginiensis]
MSGALLVAGTTSDAGKSVVTAGICRWLVREGVSVAPFKAQNMSNNSVVTPDGAEIGRAQVMQAAAARVEPEAAMNPVLLKPGGENSSQVVVLGRPVADVTALSYRPMKAALLEQVLSSLAELRARFDVVVCEGAGSPTEINLRADDIANMGLATAADLPVVVVGDIDRGGVFAALHGTVALMPPADQRLVAGFLVNKFRGDVRLLHPGLDQLTALTGRPALGVLPWVGGLEMDGEDSLDVPVAASGAPPVGDDVLRVSVARLPRLSNFTDLDALAAEPGVLVRYATRPEELADADLVVLPGSRATVADLSWLRATGLADAVLRRAAEGTPVLGVCGGHQMLARTITDEVESRAGTVAGLGLLPADVRFAPEKTLARPVGSALGETVHGYEIHHGVVTVDWSSDAPPALPFLDGARAGAVFGTTWHGALENDGFRRAFLTEVARITGRRFVPASATEFAAVREARLDRLGDLVAEHADTDALWRLIEAGAPPGLPLLPPGSGFSPR